MADINDAGASRSPYDTYTATCPYCGAKGCEADWCDIGVGLTQCGPFHCECGATEIGPFDKNVLTDEEKKTGWFKPGRFGTSANTVFGVGVDHKTAKKMYEMGILDSPDEKERKFGPKGS